MGKKPCEKHIFTQPRTPPKIGLGSCQLPTMNRCRRVVFYAVNGIGAGHLTRLVSIARVLRRLASERNCAVEIYFLTTSEAGKIAFAERFATLKFPSALVAAESGVPEDEHRTRAQRWVRQALESLAPDVIVVDTFPDGAFGELPELLPRIRRKICVYRPSKLSLMQEEAHLLKLEAYDWVLIPEHEIEVNIDFPQQLRRKIRYFGPVMIRNQSEALSRGEARAALGAVGNQKIVYLTCGGGGDERAEQILLSCLDSLVKTDNLIVVGAGPLYRGRVQYGPNIRWIEDGVACELMCAFDVAISAAGYNSFNELMYFGVPTIFLPQPRYADDQFARAQRAVQEGAAVMLSSADSDEIAARAVELLGDLNAAIMGHNAQQIVSKNYSGEFATAIFDALDVADPEPVAMTIPDTRRFWRLLRSTFSPRTS
jgi:UDP-N-acetylglucosamine--N-acetylmuramyl-(pentapeptide) pyrophosphoryl-undecaprenol N-acetylglucosamine transferase